MATTPIDQSFGGENSFQFGRELLNNLKQSFQTGLDGFLHAFGQTGAGATAAGVKSRHTLVVCGTASPFKQNWTPDSDWYVTGWNVQSGFALSLNPNYAKFAAIVNQNGFLNDVLLICPVSSSVGTAMGDVQVPIYKNVTLTFYGNVAGVLQLFLLPLTDQTTQPS